MCGIVGYTGPREAYPVILKGLKRLEYRGYDSSGVALLNNGHLNVYKKKGKVAELEESVLGKDLHAHIGIGHTRWATHGEPSDRNAHPHQSQSGELAMIHNGIIENYTQIKQELVSKGYHFKSDTDTEVLLNFIEDIKKNNHCSLEEALRIALKRVVGAYCILLISNDDPETIIAARKGSPLVIGIGKGEHFLASDASPIIEYTKEVVYVNDYEIAIVKPDELILKNLGNEKQTPFITKLDMDLAAIEKGGYEHFMLKEIHEQPRCVEDCLGGRIDGYRVKLGGLLGYEEILSKAEHITILACGTSWHAGLLAKYYLEEFCKIKVSVEYASEFRYRKPYIKPGDIIIGISQSGETADTLSALELAKVSGAVIVGICNVVNSSMTRLTDCGIFTRAGMEIGVASTKAFTTQVICLLLLALWIEQNQKSNNMDIDYRKSIIDGLRSLDDVMRKCLANSEKVKSLAKTFKKSKNCLYLGRQYNFPVALEGALKLKEISYVHAEGYPAAEMKHGPIALIDKNMPVIVVANNRNQHDKISSNIKEIQARDGKVITISNEKDIDGDYNIHVPFIIDPLCPLVSIIPLQLFSYYSAVLRGCNVDKPRNLAKSVTVE